MEDKRYIVSIVQRNTIDGDLFLYNHICTTVGTIEEDEFSRVFIDDQGREYYNLTSDESTYSSYPYAYASPLTLDEAYLMFKKDGVGPDAKEIMEAYDDRFGRYFYLVAEGLEEEKYMYAYDIDDLIGTLANIATNKNNNVKKYELQDLTEAINENIFSKEQLKDLRNDLVSRLELAKQVMTNIDSKIKDPKYYLKESKIENAQKAKAKEIKNENQTNYSDTEKYKNAELSKNESKKDSKSYIDIKKVFNNVSKTLIDQDEAAKRVITEIARLELNEDNRYGILLTGSTGVGKTKLMSLIAKYIGRPFFTVDTTQLTSPGYTGRNIEEFLWQLYKDCGKDINKAERAIVYFDEIDKKGSGRKDDVGGRAVLNILLKFLDGTTYKATENMQHTFSTVDINTSKMIVIASGAFTDVYKNFKNNPVGFSSFLKNNNIDNQPTIEDFVENGMMPDEFMGRFPIIQRLEDLKHDSFIHIMDRSDESPLKIEQNNFKKIGVKLSFTEGSKEKIADRAEKLKTGARGLKGVVLNATYKSFEYAKENAKDIEEIIITEETIDDGRNYTVRPKIKAKTKRR